jgi:hypothetical protein
MFVALGLLIWAIFEHLNQRTVTGWTSLIMSLWFIGGALLIAIGIVGEYVGKIYMEVMRRPLYNIMYTFKKG